MLWCQSRRCAPLAILACREGCPRGCSVNYAAICLPSPLLKSGRISENTQHQLPNQGVQWACGSSYPIPQGFESKVLPNVKLRGALHPCEWGHVHSWFDGKGWAETSAHSPPNHSLSHIQRMALHVSGNLIFQDPWGRQLCQIEFYSIFLPRQASVFCPC